MGSAAHFVLLSPAHDRVTVAGFSHVRPVYAAVHTHLMTSPKATHLPPFRHVISPQSEVKINC